jgi:hypothetical protein
MFSENDGLRLLKLAAAKEKGGPDGPPKSR